MTNSNLTVHDLEGVSIGGLVSLLKLKGYSHKDLASQLSVGWGKLASMESGKDAGTGEMRTRLEGLLIGLKV